MFSVKTINNDIYDTKGHTWWDENESAATLRFFINPVRFAYFQRIVAARTEAGWRPKTVLDVGCGGGFLTEEFAKAGFEVTGIDPSETSLTCAREHAISGGLAIKYLTGRGESIPAESKSSDVVLCCDVLEHVEAIEPVLREVSRVLKPGGAFLYDTINRTPASYLVAIKVLQDWRWTAQHEPRGHVWHMFIKPGELNAALARTGLTPCENRGIAASAHPLSVLMNLRRRVKGEITFRELGYRMGLRESDDLSMSYMGYAVKDAGAKP